MKLHVISLVFRAVLASGLLVFCGWAQTELDAGEQVRLRELLRVNPTAKISLNPTAALPPAASLKVYLGFGFDFATRNQLARWIERWNPKQGQQFGRLEIVEDLTAAQIILSGFQADMRGDQVPNASPNRFSGPISLSKTAQEVYVPLLFYILVPANNELVVIQRGRYDEKLSVENKERTALADNLRDSLIALLKKRQKTR